MVMPEPLPSWSRWIGLGLLALMLGAIGWAVVQLARGEEGEVSVFAATADGTRLTLSIESCNAKEIDIAVEESADEVVVAARVTDPANGDDCADGATVTLAAPLGDRRLVDGLSGRELHCEPAGDDRTSCTTDGG
jgi:hypothetical protein